MTLGPRVPIRRSVLDGMEVWVLDESRLKRAVHKLGRTISALARVGRRKSKGWRRHVRRLKARGILGAA